MQVDRGHGPRRSACDRCCRRISTRAPTASCPSSSSSTASACRRGSSAGRGSISSSPAVCAPDAHPFFPKLATAARLRACPHPPRRPDRPIRAVPARAPGTPGESQYLGRRPATISPSASSLKARTTCPTRMRSTHALARLIQRAAGGLSVARARAHRRPQRYRARPQDRPGPAFDWARLRASLL